VRFRAPLQLVSDDFSAKTQNELTHKATAYFVYVNYF
jgi:hypothetical protein